MKHTDFADALRRQTECVRVSPDLRQRTLDAAYGKEKIIMKRKLPIAALAAILSLLLCAAALAAAGQLGLTDYFSNQVGVTIPEGMAGLLQTDAMSFEDENFTFSVRELLYDGQTVHAAVDVTPKADKTLLLGVDSLMSDRWYDLISLRPNADRADERTIQQVFDEEGYETAYRAEIHLFDPTPDIEYSSTGDFCLNEDGTLTYFENIQFADSQPERELTLKLVYQNVPTGDASEFIIKTAAEKKTLKLTSNVQSEVFVSAEPVKMEDVGITIDQLQMTATPIGLYGTLFYTIDENELPAGLSIYDLTLMLIDPAIETDEPYHQQLNGGLMAGGIAYPLSAEGETPVRYVQYFSIDRSELRDSYTIRAYNPYGEAKAYYEPVELTMKPATADDALMTAD